MLATVSTQHSHLKKAGASSGIKCSVLNQLCCFPTRNPIVQIIQVQYIIFDSHRSEWGYNWLQVKLKRPGAAFSALWPSISISTAVDADSVENVLAEGTCALHMHHISGVEELQSIYKQPFSPLILIWQHAWHGSHLRCHTLLSLSYRSIHNNVDPVLISMLCLFKLHGIVKRLQELWLLSKLARRTAACWMCTPAMCFAVDPVMWARRALCTTAYLCRCAQSRMHSGVDFTWASGTAQQAACLIVAAAGKGRSQWNSC